MLAYAGRAEARTAMRPILAASPFRGVRNVAVGLEPVAVTVKPNGSEVWVSNHVSDSISAIP